MTERVSVIGRIIFEDKSKNPIDIKIFYKSGDILYCKIIRDKEKETETDLKKTRGLHKPETDT